MNQAATWVRIWPSWNLVPLATSMSSAAPSRVRQCLPAGAPSGSGEFEEHGQRGLPGAVAFGATVTQADGGEGRFDRVRGSHMLPVFGGEVVEGHEYVAVFLQAVGRFEIFGRVVLQEIVKGFDRFRASLHYATVAALKHTDEVHIRSMSHGLESVDRIGDRLYELVVYPPSYVSDAELISRIKRVASRLGTKS